MKSTLIPILNKHSKGNATVHLVWIPKRRKKVLVGSIAKRLRQIFYDLAKEKDWDIIALEVAPDHIHLFVEHQPDVAINQVIKAFKGRSSCYLRREFPELREIQKIKYPALPNIFWVKPRTAARCANRRNARAGYFITLKSLNKLPSLWTNSYFYSTAGQVSAEVIDKYIKDPHHG